MTRPRADQLLVDKGLFESRARAQAAIEAGLVRANGHVVGKPSQRLNPNAALEAQEPYPWVSRGGLKLVHALDHFGYDPKDRLCLDVGASTGGFSHVLLERGTAHVYAVDTGHGQLHASLADHPRLTSWEGTDVRSLTASHFPHPPQGAVVDVSFISLDLILPTLASLLSPGAFLVTLIKPQFEVGRAHVSRQGIVKDDGLRQEVCARIVSSASAIGFGVDGVIVSPIEGGSGNQEFLMGARRG